MKKLIVFAFLAALLSANVHADWDPALEAREAAERKAEQQRAARQKAEHNKMIRESSAKAYREALGKEAVGKSDAEVERIYKKRESDAVKQAAAVSKSGYAASGQAPQLDANTRLQSDAQMKGMTGKSMTDLSKMNEKELEVLAREMEKKYGK